MRLTFIFYLYLFICCTSVFAKEVSGMVLDNDSTPLKFVNITAFRNNSIIAGQLTDESGKFRIEIGEECDRLLISYICYDEVNIEPTSSDLGNIILKHTATTLKEVVVKAPVIRRESDRIIMNVSANPNASNKNAHELLKTAPGVWATDKSLSIYGQDGTFVYIDDIKVNMSGEQLMTYLKTIPSASITSIEIIPKAGAEYSADSTGGIIKINLKRNRIEGIKGSTGLNSTIGKYKFWMNPFFNLGLHSGKWTINLNGSVNGSPSERYSILEESTYTSLSQEMCGISRHNDKCLQGNLLLGITFQPTVKDKLGIQLDYNSERALKKTTSKTTFNGLNNISNTSGSYSSKDAFNNFNGTINWIHKIDTIGSELKLVANYNLQISSALENNKMNWNELVYDSIFRNKNTNHYNIFVSELSLRKVISSKWNILLGCKYTFNEVSITSLHDYLENSIWIANKTFDYDTSYRENIAAFYAVVNGKFEKWKFKAGIRGELSMNKGDYTYKKHMNLFPNFNVSYDITEKGDFSVSIGYYRNIRRPSFWSLNPAIRQISDFTYSVGNPLLTPSISNGVTIDFLLAGKFTIAAGYSNTNKPIQQVFLSNPDYPERMYLSWDNEGKNHNAYIHGDGLINLTNWWNLYSSITYVIMSLVDDKN